MFALAFFTILPGRAYAVSEQVIINDGIVTKPNSDQVTRGFMVLAYNRLNAGALICGYDPSTFTAEQKAKLSQKISGNNFYGLCSYLSTTEDSGVPYWASSNYQLFSTIWDLNSDVAGMDLWIGDFSEHELELAKRDIQKVLDGEELVPPSGDQPDNRSYIEFTYHPSQYFADVTKVRFDITDMFIYGSDFSVIKSGELSINSVDATNSKLSFGLALFTSSQFNVVEDGGRKKAQIESGDYTTMVGGGYTYSITDDVMTIRKTGDGSNTSLGLSLQTPPSYPFTISMKDDYGIFNGIIDNTGDWPDDPPVVAPSPPELPTPHDPVIPNPPTDPTPPEPPTYITQPYYVTNIFTADLQGILDALDEHCQHLQNALYSNLKSLNDNLVAQISSEGSSLRSSFGSRVSWLGDIIQRTIDTLDFNIYSYFQWLADQFDFQSSGGYNDSTVVAWLKKIYAKLGGGSPVNPKPVDPVSDPFDFGEWLYNLWKNFVLDLIALGADGIAEIAHDLGELIHKFPFSIPWDIAAMLALLAAEPQTPVITWPMFYLDAAGVQAVQTTIDLHPYDNYVEPVRVMIKIAFAAVLAWRTKDMMELLTAARGGNSA